MNWSSRHTILVCSASLFLGAGLWVGCGGDDTTTPTNDAGTDTSSNPDTGKPDTGGNDSGGTDGGGTDGGGGDGAVTLPSNCKEYCTLVQATCTTTNGQYLDQATCEAMCAKFPGGDAGAGDGGVTTGNSLACRIYHTTVAAQSSGNAVTHCPHAGPYGFGGCGSELENFCLLRAAQCTGNGGYGGNCPQSFGQIADIPDSGFVISAATGNNRDCREYHLENAYKGNVTTGSHCDHAGQTGGGVCQ